MYTTIYGVVEFSSFRRQPASVSTKSRSRLDYVSVSNRLRLGIVPTAPDEGQEPANPGYTNGFTKTMIQIPMVSPMNTTTDCPSIESYEDITTLLCAQLFISLITNSQIKHSIFTITFPPISLTIPFRSEIDINKYQTITLIPFRSEISRLIRLISC